MYQKLAYLDLGPPVPLGASGDEKSPSPTVTDDPVGSMPGNTDLFQVLFEGASPCLLRPPPLSSAVFWHPVHCCRCGCFTLQSDDVASHFLIIVLTLSLSRSVPAFTYPVVTWVLHGMLRIVHRLAAMEDI